MGNTWSGGCQCGAIRYQISSDDILTVCCCHCTDCQRQSASAFGMSVVLPRSAYRDIAGTPVVWQFTTARGTPKRALFCPTCGVRLAHDSGPDSNVVRLKAGTLDNTGPLRPVAHLWTKRAQAWVDIDDGLLCYDTQPDGDAELCAAYAAQRRAAS